MPVLCKHSLFYPNIKFESQLELMLLWSRLDLHMVYSWKGDIWHRARRLQDGSRGAVWDEVMHDRESPAPPTSPFWGLPWKSRSDRTVLSEGKEEAFCGTWFTAMF